MKGKVKISKKAWELAGKLTEEEAKQWVKDVKKLGKDVEKEIFVPVSKVVIKALLALAQKNVKVVSLVFVKDDDEKVTVEMRIGGLRFIDGDGKETIIADTSAIKSIESEGEGEEEA